MAQNVTNFKTKSSFFILGIERKMNKLKENFIYGDSKSDKI